MSATDPRLGTELAGYRIEAARTRGMGVVYLAEDIRLKRKVALKLLTAELATNESFRERFLESRSSPPRSTIQHRPDLRGRRGRRALFIAMRYVDGSDLKERLREGTLAPEAAHRHPRPGRGRPRRRPRAGASSTGM